MARGLSRHGRQLGAHLGAVDARATVRFIRVIASFRFHRQRLHALRVGTAGLSAIVDLKRTAQELFVAQEFQELGVVVRTTADEVNGLPAGRAILHTLAAVKEPTLILLGPDVCQLGHESLARAILFGLSDVDEK